MVDDVFELVGQAEALSNVWFAGFEEHDPPWLHPLCCAGRRHRVALDNDDERQVADDFRWYRWLSDAVLPKQSERLALGEDVGLGGGQPAVRNDCAQVVEHALHDRPPPLRVYCLRTVSKCCSSSATASSGRSYLAR